MNEDIFKDIKLFIQTHYILDENKKFNTWYQEGKYHMKKENKLIKKLSKFLINKYGDFYTCFNLKKMIKLYLLYPMGLPDDIKILPWELILILVEIFDEDKRDFYVFLCNRKKLNSKTLSKYLSYDIYEKFIYTLDTYYNNDDFAKLDFDKIIDEVIYLQERII